VWQSDEELSFGFLVLPAVLLLVGLRWRPLVAAAGPGRKVALVAVVAGLLLLLASARSGVNALGGLSVLPVTLGLVAYLYGSAAARLLALPAVLLTAGLSLHRGLLAPLGFALQQLTAICAAGAAQLAGVPVQRSGVDLFTGRVHLVVTEACSGMDSLLALLCLGLLFVGLVGAPAARRALLLALVLPIIVVANVVRVTLVLVLSQPLGLAAAQGAMHPALSALLFLSATTLFVVAGLALRCTPPLPATRSSSA
jgi:exosortase